MNAQPYVEKIFINLNAPNSFSLRQKILGENSANLKYIVKETEANVSLRGRGSGFVEQNGQESNELLHLLIDHPSPNNLNEAKILASNLIETIQQELQMFLQANPQNVHIQHHPQPPPIAQTSNQQITAPQAVLSCPPPTIIQQPTHIIQQQNYIPPNVAMQIMHQNPPPNSGVRATAPILQFQGQVLQGQVQQAAGIQLQTTNGSQQILLNQPTQQYQLQYIPATNQITNAPQMQTIQHVIHPQHQIQAILQPSANGQQFITVQGNTAYMMPPPNMIQQNPPQSLNGKGKDDEQKSILTCPPPILTCPPPQYTQQAPQQFIVNTNSWPQQQQHIQIVTQPQTIRGGNEQLIIQNPMQQGGQQVITTFNPQQPGQPYQHIQFHQATITQPPPSQPQMQNVQNQQNTSSFQQQFEQKLNQSIDSQQLQQRSGKRKYEGEDSEVFPKMGMGQSSSDRSSPKTMVRPTTSNAQLNAPPAKMNVNNSGPVGASGDSQNKRNIQNKAMFSMNSNPSMSSASVVQKNVATTVESKNNTTSVRKELESSELNEMGTLGQFNLQTPPNQQGGFMLRSGNQSYRFQGPQNFIHQPPPITQNSQFSGHRGQIMSNTSMSTFQNAGQMMQPPPPVTTTHQFIHQEMNAYQQNNNFHMNNQQVQMNRFNSPQQQQHQQQQQQAPMGGGGDGNSNGMMTANYQQQPRFRQQW